MHGERLCFEDALVTGGFSSVEERRYQWRTDDKHFTDVAGTSAGLMCVPLDGPGTSLRIEARSRGFGKPRYGRAVFAVVRRAQGRWRLAEYGLLGD